MCWFHVKEIENVVALYIISWHWIGTSFWWIPFWKSRTRLTHWGRVTHICVSKLTIIGSDNGLAPGWRQTIIWTNDGILLIGPLGTNFNEILIGYQTFSFKKMHLKILSAKWHPFCLGLNVITYMVNVMAADDQDPLWLRRISLIYGSKNN